MIQVLMIYKPKVMPYGQRYGRRTYIATHTVCPRRIDPFYILSYYQDFLDRQHTPGVISRHGPSVGRLPNSNNLIQNLIIPCSPLSCQIQNKGTPQKNHNSFLPRIARSPTAHYCQEVLSNYRRILNVKMDKTSWTHRMSWKS